MLHFPTRLGSIMPVTRDGLASVSLGSTKEIGLRLVADGRLENLSEACRAGLRRLAEDARFIDRLVTLGKEGVWPAASMIISTSTFLSRTHVRAGEKLPWSNLAKDNLQALRQFPVKRRGRDVAQRYLEDVRGRCHSDQRGTASRKKLRLPMLLACNASQGLTANTVPQPEAPPQQVVPYSHAPTLIRLPVGLKP